MKKGCPNCFLQIMTSLLVSGLFVTTVFGCSKSTSSSSINDNDDDDGVSTCGDLECSEINQTGGWDAELQITDSDSSNGGVVGKGVVIDSQNRCHAVWNHIPSTGKYAVYYARSDAGCRSWEKGNDIAQSTIISQSPNIALGPDDTLHVVWLDRRDGGEARVYYSRSLDGGDTWKTPRDLSGENSEGGETPHIGVDQNNRVHITWHLGDSDKETPIVDAYYVRSPDGGETFDSIKQLNTGSGHAAFPRFTVQGTSGDLIAIAWRDNRKGTSDWDIYMTVSTDGGAHFTEKEGQTSSSVEWDPDVLVDDQGVIHLSYMLYGREGISIEYQRSADQGNSWSEPKTLSEAHSRFPFWPANNSTDVLWLFWKDERDAEKIDSDKVVYHSNYVARYSTDGGTTWSSLETVVDLGNLDMQFPSPAVGPDGIPVVVWSDLRYGESLGALFSKKRSVAP